MKVLLSLNAEKIFLVLVKNMGVADGEPRIGESLQVNFLSKSDACFE